MNKWEEKRLGDVCTKITKGTTPTTLGNSFVNSGINFIKSESITNSKFLDKNKYAFIDEITYHKLNRSKIEVNDILFSMAGMFLGKTAIVQEKDLPANTNQAVAIIRINTQHADYNYLYYYLSQKQIKDYINLSTAQSAQPNINLAQISKLPIKLPPLPTQQKIADILSAYDDLIENNNRRIELLEKAAQNLYKEWFVRFRFPNHKQTKFENGLPQGWVVKKLSEFVYVTDGTHDTPKQTESGYYLVTGKCITNDFIDFSKAYFISKADHDKIKKRSGLNKGDILFSNIGTVGSVSIIDYDIDFSVKNVIILKTQINIEKCYLYCLLKNSTIQDLFKQQTNGSSQQFISLRFMRNFKVLIPENKILEQFTEVAQPIIAEKYSLYKQNRNLIKQRDLLLSRLMSGKLEV